MCFSDIGASAFGKFYIPDANGTGWVELPYDQLNQPIRYPVICYSQTAYPKPKAPGYKSVELTDAVNKNLTYQAVGLLNEGADPNDNYGDKYGDLLLVAIEKDNPVILKALIDAGIRPVFQRIRIFW